MRNLRYIYFMYVGNKYLERIFNRKSIFFFSEKKLPLMNNQVNMQTALTLYPLG